MPEVHHVETQDSFVLLLLFQLIIVSPIPYISNSSVVWSDLTGVVQGLSGWFLSARVLPLAIRMEEQSCLCEPSCPENSYLWF